MVASDIRPFRHLGTLTRGPFVDLIYTPPETGDVYHAYEVRGQRNIMLTNVVR